MLDQWVKIYLGNFNFGSWGMDKGWPKLGKVMPFFQMATTQPFMNHFWSNLDWMIFVPCFFKKKFFDPHQGGIGRFICHHKFTRVIPESLKKSCLYKNFYKICFVNNQNWLKFWNFFFLKEPLTKNIQSKFDQKRFINGWVVAICKNVLMSNTGAHPLSIPHDPNLKLPR